MLNAVDVYFVTDILETRLHFKKYKLEEVIQAHKDLEGRKILGPAIIVPN